MIKIFCIISTANVSFDFECIETNYIVPTRCIVGWTGADEQQTYRNGREINSVFKTLLYSFKRSNKHNAPNTF